jgi:hypothetical protein
MKGIVKRYYTILFILCLGSALEAQEIKIYGTLQDSETLAGISYANISFPGSKTGCSTNLKGEFSVTPDTIPAYMIVSHLGYETQRIWLENTSGALNILMKPVAKMLKEVEIKSMREPVPFFKDDHYAVLDYEVDNTLVYLLIFRFRLAKSELICMADNGDTVARSNQLGFRPTGLFADCLGYIHVISEDSAYQAFLKKDTIIFPHKADIFKFRSTLSNCVASTDDQLFFREESPDHQIVNFFYINRENKQKQYLASVIDEAGLNMLRRNPYDYYLFMMDTLPNTNLEMEEWSLVNNLLYRPNNSVLEKSGDTLAIFNTTDGSFNLYDLNGNLISGSKMPVGNKSGEKWTGEIIVDQITGITYTYFIKNGRFIIYRINLKTGDLTRILVTGHVFPRKLRIHHNCLFYLYDLPGTGDNKHLFKQNLL